MEHQRTERLQKRPQRKRRFYQRDGRPREVKPFEKVLMCLLSLRHNTSHEIVGRLFGKSADTEDSAFVEVLPVLQGLFPNQKWEAERSYGREVAKWTPAKVELGDRG